GDARFSADMRIFHETRSLEGTPRWALALSDDDVSTAGLFKAFRCVLGFPITMENAPKTWNLIVRSNADVFTSYNAAKNAFQHKRPFQVAEGNVCVSPQGKAALERNPDYPSGHTATSWETGLVLTQVAPDLANDLLARARAFGESRVVCGV